MGSHTTGSQSTRRHNTQLSPETVSRQPTFGVVWWLCLASLIANDHYLKRADILPTEFTGKLSDFAGLYVATVLLAVLLRPHSRFRCVGAFTLVTSIFVSINLWPSASEFVVHALETIGIHWRLWPDPTDLIALAVLPFAWRSLATPAKAPLAIPTAHATFRIAVHRSGIAIGALACVATSGNEPQLPKLASGPALINRTMYPADVEIRSFRHRFADCTDPNLGLEQRPVPGDFYPLPDGENDVESEQIDYWGSTLLEVPCETDTTGDTTGDADYTTTDVCTVDELSIAAYNASHTATLDRARIRAVSPTFFDFGSDDYKSGDNYCVALWARVEGGPSAVVTWKASQHWEFHQLLLYPSESRTIGEADFQQLGLTIEGPVGHFKFGTGSQINEVDGLSRKLEEELRDQQ